MIGLPDFSVRRWWATVLNELRQLIRDRVGLVLLFIMPAALVLVITLVQDPLLKQEGEGFRVKFVGSRAKDRTFESLPSLLQGLQAIFLEIRMAGEGLRGFDALARAKEDAREDVLAASRKIHSALGTV